MCWLTNGLALLPALAIIAIGFMSMPWNRLAHLFAWGPDAD